MVTYYFYWTSSLQVLIISDSHEMQQFIKKVKAAFRRKEKIISNEERREYDLSIDASILPDAPEIRHPETHTQGKRLFEKSPDGNSTEPIADLTARGRGPEKCDTHASRDVPNIPPKNQRREWSVSDAGRECAKFGEIDKEKQSEIVTKANKAMQSLPEYFYDFCMVSSEEDYDEAKVLKDEISAKFNLRGCTIYEDDFFTLGRDSFEAYEQMMDRSTKIFFYISDTLNENAFCRRLQSASVFQGLMSKVRKEKEKCVPVFPKGICRVPLALSGISGLEIPNERLTAQRLRITYKEEVRQQRILQEQEKWKAYFVKIVSEEVEKCQQDYKRNDLANDSTSSDSDDEDEGDDRGNKSTSIPPNGFQIPQSSGFFNGVEDMIQHATSAPVVTSSELNIDSNTAHIGHNITINVHCHKVSNEVDQTDTSDSSSTLSDS